jgi:hypothetical protein
MIVVQVEKIEAMTDEHGNPQGYGEGPRWTQDYRFEGRVIAGEGNIKSGTYDYFKAGFKKPPQAGDTEPFELRLKKDGGGPISFPDGVHADGSKLWRRVVARPKQDNRSNGPSGGYRATQGASSGGGGTSATPMNRNVPTVTDRGREILGLLPRAIKIAGRQVTEEFKPSDDAILAAAVSITMHWLISIEHGNLKHDATAEELEAAKAEAARKAEEAAKEAERLAAEAAKQQALAGMGPAPEANDDIPF